MGNVKQQGALSKDGNTYGTPSPRTIDGKDGATFNFVKRTKEEIQRSRNPAYSYMIK